MKLIRIPFLENEVFINADKIVRIAPLESEFNEFVKSELEYEVGAETRSIAFTQTAFEVAQAVISRVEPS